LARFDNHPILQRFQAQTAATVILGRCDWRWGHLPPPACVREHGPCIGFVMNDARRMDSELAERLNRLESTIAHLEHTTELLNEVVTVQGRELAQLKKKYLLQSQSLDAIELERIRSTNSKPPHYG
jgi:uncharacterized coiled-coil protein SlyX